MGRTYKVADDPAGSTRHSGRTSSGRLDVDMGAPPDAGRTRCGTDCALRCRMACVSIVCSAVS